jgi:hypothetical protein
MGNEPGQVQYGGDDERGCFQHHHPKVSQKAGCDCPARDRLVAATPGLPIVGPVLTLIINVAQRLTVSVLARSPFRCSRYPENPSKREGEKPGAISLSTSNHLEPMSVSKLENPVRFPPG